MPCTIPCSVLFFNKWTRQRGTMLLKEHNDIYIFMHISCVPVIPFKRKKFKKSISTYLKMYRWTDESTRMISASTGINRRSWPDFFSQGALEVRLPQTVASLQTLKNSKECYVCILRTFKIPFLSIVTLVPCSRLRFSLNGLLRLISRKCKILCHWIVTLASLAPLGFFFFRFIL